METFNTIGTVVEKASEDEISACTNASGDIIPFDLSKYLDGHVKEDFDDGISSYYGGLGYDSNANNYKNMPYMFVTFSWSYTLENFPGYTFNTPSIITPTVENTVFINN